MRTRHAGGAFLALAFGVAAQAPAIRLVPRVVDPLFSERSRLCAEDSSSTEYPRANDERRAVQDLFGPDLIEIQIHQMGDSLQDSGRARAHVTALLRARPRSVTRFANWAEATPLRTWGVIGSVHYAGDRVGRIEVAGNHLCFTDFTGVTWWMRLEVIDVWPERR